MKRRSKVVLSTLGVAAVEEGSFVRAGQPLMEIRPDPTPVELVEARRQVELNGIEAANARRDLERAADQPRSPAFP